MKKLAVIKFLFLFILVSLMNKSYSQLVHAKAEEFKIIKKRTLLVQLLEEDADEIARMEKKIEKEKKEDKKAKAQKELDDTRQFIQDYNKFIKDAVTKYWDLNEKVEYKTISEIKKLRDAKSNKYTVLYYSETSSSKTDEYGFRYFQSLTVPTLNYSRLEAGAFKVDYSFFMHRTSMDKLNYGDIILSLILMKNHIAEIEKSGKKKYTFKDYAKDEGEKNCSELKGKTVHIDKALIHDKTTEKEMEEKFTTGKLEFVSTDDVAKAIEEEKDELYAFAIPNTIAAGSAGPLSVARITFYRCFINVKTGKIYTCKGVNMGEFNDQYVRAKELGSLSECK